ncbi:MAG: beta-lactamase domain protein [Pseudonocardiales bacterium]|nr:beta-lactamase domain protein [Pseudonocardiales bacterium]
MRLSVLGCSGSAPGPDSPASGYLVQHDGFSLVLDLGNGAFGELVRHVRASEVGAIVLSHLHPDHCIDIVAFGVALRHGRDSRADPIPVMAPSGARSRLLSAARADAAQPPPEQEMAGFAFTEPFDAMVGPFALTFARMVHSVPTYAVRVSLPGGPSLVYSGDTGPSQALAHLARGADLLLCEASFVAGEPGPSDLHLSGSEAGAHAAQAGVGRLVITHVPPWNSREAAVAEARSTFAGPVEAAGPRAVYEL